MRIDDVFARIEAEHPEIAEFDPQVDPPAILALNVIQMRSRRGMTQAQLAEAIGVAQPRIAEVERGDANPRLITISRIAHALGVTLAELLEDNLFGNRAESPAEASPRPNVGIDAPAARKRGTG